MFCSTCGTAIPANLNYCKNCGARIEKNPVVVSNSSRSFSVAAGLIGVVGLGGVFPLLKILLESRLDQPSILFVLIAYLITVFLIFAMLVGHSWRNSGRVHIASLEPDEYKPPNSFRGVNTAQLPEHHEPATSVTEHTTRTLDKVRIE